MKPAAAFQATYSDWRLIKGRKVIQIVLEVPLEGADVAYTALGGMPDPAKEVWVGVARLDTNNRLRDTPDRGDPQHRGKEGGAELPGFVPPSRSKLKRAFDELTPTHQAGILCNDKAFHKFLEEHYPNAWKLLNEGTPEEQAAEMVRYLCGVKSRKDIVSSTDAIRVWKEMVSDYRAWMHEPQYA